jgi:glutamyl-tRNA reductase
MLRLLACSASQQGWIQLSLESLKLPHTFAMLGSKAERLEQLGVTAVSCDDRLADLKRADIVVCSTSCSHSLISREDARSIAKARQYKSLVVIDIAVPRNVDPRAGDVEGVYLFNLDSLEAVVKRARKETKIRQNRPIGLWLSK